MVVFIPFNLFLRQFVPTVGLIFSLSLPPSLPSPSTYKPPKVLSVHSPRHFVGCFIKQVFIIICLNLPPSFLTVKHTDIPRHFLGGYAESQFISVSTCILFNAQTLERTKSLMAGKKFLAFSAGLCLYLAVLRSCGNFLCICREMEYIIPFLFILTGKRFCWGPIDAVSLSGARAVPQARRSQSAGNGEKKVVLKRNREFCCFCTQCSVLDQEIE